MQGQAADEVDREFDEVDDELDEDEVDGELDEVDREFDEADGEFDEVDGELDDEFDEVDELEAAGAAVPPSEAVDDVDESLEAAEPEPDLLRESVR